MASEDFDIFNDLNTFLDKPDEYDFDINISSQETTPTCATTNNPKNTKKGKRKKTLEIQKEPEEIITIEDNFTSPHEKVQPKISRAVRTRLNDLRKELQDICKDNYTFIDEFPSPKKQCRRNAKRRCNIRPTATVCLDTYTNTSEVEKIDLVDSDECELSFDSTNHELSIKIHWMGKIERFNSRMNDKFCVIINMLAERENENPNFIILNLDDRIIKPEDTPASIGYTISKFLYGRIVKSNTNFNENLIEIKIQTESLKKPFPLKISKFVTMNDVLKMCGKELNLNPKKMKLRFDGDILELESTALDLEFDGGEILDCLMIKDSIKKKKCSS